MSLSQWIGKCKDDEKTSWLRKHAQRYLELQLELDMVTMKLAFSVDSSAMTMMRRVILRLCHREMAAAVVGWCRKLDVARKRARAARMMKQAGARMLNRGMSDAMMDLRHHMEMGKEHRRRGLLLRRVLGRLRTRELAMSWAELHSNWSKGVADGSFSYVQQLRAAVDTQSRIHARQVVTLKYELSALNAKHRQLLLDHISLRQRPAIAHWYRNYRFDLADIWEKQATLFKARLDHQRKCRSAWE